MFFLALRNDAGRFEGKGREFFHLEEVRALQVRVALRVACVYGRRVDGDLHLRLGRISFVALQRAGNARELALYIRNHHVLDLELGHGVRRINGPSAYRGLLRSCWCCCCHGIGSFRLVWIRCVATIFVATNSSENLEFTAGSAEQFTKGLEPLTPQVSELLPVPFLH